MRETLITIQNEISNEQVRQMSRNAIPRSAARRRTGHQSTTRPHISRYDVVLAVIPLVFAVAFLATAVAGISLPTAMAAASVLGLGLILDTIFFHPPVPTQ